MISFFAEIEIFRFWPKTMDYNKVFWPKLSSFLSALITPHWNVLRSWNLHHSAPLQMAFPMIPFFLHSAPLEMYFCMVSETVDDIFFAVQLEIIQ